MADLPRSWIPEYSRPAFFSRPLAYQKIANLTAAVEGGAAVAPLVAKLQERQAERDALVAAITTADALGQVELDRREIERKVLAQVEHWRELLALNQRQFLREAIDGPIAFTPEGEEYRFEGKTVTGKLIAAWIGDSTFYGVPNGIRPRVIALERVTTNVGLRIARSTGSGPS